MTPLAVCHCRDQEMPTGVGFTREAGPRAPLRTVGIPARYVSGYLRPVPEPEIGVAVEGQSHAGSKPGPAAGGNSIAVGPRHVAVGSGRDHADVSPLKGIYAGGGEDTMTASVAIRRLR